MPRCIYCKIETTGQEGEAHAIPQALYQNENVLPPGAECDACNNYLGDLDLALVLHQQVWLGIQALGLPGRRGRPRIDLGWMSRRDPSRPNVVTIEGRGKNTLFLDGNHIRIETEEAPGWNPDKFRRSLHYLAVNYLALTEGPEFMLQDEFDLVRRYVRFPKRREQWPYGEIQSSHKLLRQIRMNRLQGSPDGSRQAAMEVRDARATVRWWLIPGSPQAPGGLCCSARPSLPNSPPKALRVRGPLWLRQDSISPPPLIREADAKVS